MRQGKAVAAGNADPSRDLDSDPLLAGVPVDEGYKVLGGVGLYEKIGSGGRGAVSRGRHLRLGVFNSGLRLG